MTDFLAKSPTLDSNWRAVVLFGRNVASYKFALAKTLLELSDRPDDRMPLKDLAGLYARHLCEHLGRTDKQATSRSSQFLVVRLRNIVGTQWGMLLSRMATCLKV